MDMILAVDLGTTAIKTSLFDQHGRLLAKALREYELSTPTATSVELDVEVYWGAFKQTVAEILVVHPGAPGQIRALGISAQGETLICADERGEAIRPAVVWLDNRAQDEADELAAHFTNEECYRVTGQVSFVPTWPAAKILWLRKHEPDTFRRTSSFMLIEDWLIKRLTGVAACEGSLVTSTTYWDFTKRAWWPEMLG